MNGTGLTIIRVRIVSDVENTSQAPSSSLLGPIAEGCLDPDLDLRLRSGLRSGSLLSAEGMVVYRTDLIRVRENVEIDDDSSSRAGSDLTLALTIHLMPFVLATNAYDNFHADTTTTHVHHLQADRVLR